MHRPSLSGIALAALALAAPAGAAWREATSDHFRIYADSEEPALRAYAEKLERFDGALRALRRVPKEGSTLNKLTIFALPTASDISQLYGKGGAYVGGWYAPRSNGSVAFTPLARAGESGPAGLTAGIVLLHEYTHHFFFRTSNAAYPAWFVEGYAEFMSTARIEPDGGVILGIGAAHRAAQMAALGIDPKGLLTRAQATKLQDVGPIYSTGWLLTHYLLFDQTRKGQLEAYLAAFNRGVPSGKAAQDAFGDLAALGGELRRYVMRRQLPATRIAPERISPGPIAIRLLGPGEQAMMQVHIRSTRGVDAAQAKALLPQARRAAAPFPNDPRVQTWLAEAEFDVGNLAEAEAAADRALAAAPRDPAALGYRAGVAQARAAKAPAAERAAALAEARRRIVAANRADPDVPQPLIDYYGSFAQAGATPTAAAVAGLRRAAALAPEAQGLQLLLARQLLVEGKPEEARGALAPIAYSPHAGSAGEAAGGIVRMIEGGERDREKLVAAADKAFGLARKDEAEGGGG